MLTGIITAVLGSVEEAVLLFINWKCNKPKERHLSTEGNSKVTANSHKATHQTQTADNSFQGREFHIYSTVHQMETDCALHHNAYNNE